MMESTGSRKERLLRAQVLVELGELYDAELEVAQLLDSDPSELDALSLLAKIKHMRGQLSQAIACWAQIHQLSPVREAALMHLRSILHLAQDPERGAGEFLALGQFQLVRKPVAHLELEEAFRLFLSRRPVEARRHCDQVAQKYRGGDREMYKLAVLASAWIAELSGDLLAATTILERLGSERGFETDLDRVLSLVRLYEKLDTRDKLEAAAQICRYLEQRFDGISILARLAGIYHRLGNQDRADFFALRYWEGFRARMHRPTFEDVLHIASKTYLPIERLRRLDREHLAVPQHLSQREEAIDLAVRGEPAEAGRLLEESAAPIDRKYLAEMVALGGDSARAVQLYIDALRTDTADVRIIHRVLSHADGPKGGAVRKAFQDADLTREAEQALQAAINMSPLRPSLWRDLAILQEITKRPTEAQNCRQRAEALDMARKRDARPLGRVLAAGVYHFVGRSKGLIHEVWAQREVAEPGMGGTLPTSNVLGNLTPEMRVNVQNTFLSVREYARSKFPHLTSDILDFNYSYKVTKEDEPSGGLSAGLPTALAFLSVFVQRPVPQDLAATGSVVADAHDVLQVLPIGDSEHKVKAAYNRNLRMMIMPTGNRSELSQNTLIPAQVRKEIVRYAGDLDEAVRLVFGADSFVAHGPAQADDASTDETKQHSAA